jgi:hypothetical protein
MALVMGLYFGIIVGAFVVEAVLARLAPRVPWMWAVPTALIGLSVWLFATVPESTHGSGGLDGLGNALDFFQVLLGLATLAAGIAVAIVRALRAGRRARDQLAAPPP